MANSSDPRPSAGASQAAPEDVRASLPAERGPDGVITPRDKQIGQSRPLVPSSAWDLGTKRIVVVCLLLSGLVMLWAIRPLIPLLVIAGVIAYFLSPLVDLGERVRIPRAISTLVLYMLLIVGIVLTPILLVPVLLSQLASLNFDVQATAIRLFSWAATSISNLPDTVELFGFTLSLAGLTEQLEQNFRNFAFIPTLAEILGYFQQLISTATNVVGSTAIIGVTVVGSIIQVIVTFLLILFLSLYLTKDSPSIRNYIEGLFPRNYQSEWIDLFRRMGHIWQAFFRGQLILCLVVGLTTWIALELAGMPGALLLGLLAGALEIIPTLGPTLSMIPAVFIALIQGSDVLAAYGINNLGFALVTVGIYFIIQQLENYILVPRIIGKGVNLHPIVVLIGVAIGFNLFGILGALFAAPVLASLRVLGAYIHAKLLDYEPFQDQPSRSSVQRSRRVYRRTVTGDELAARANGTEGAAARPAASEPAAQPEPTVPTSAPPPGRAGSEPAGRPVEPPSLNPRDATP
jgi:predicted PurR-regulated permease PerM